jgi:hypothetical protein
VARTRCGANAPPTERQRARDKGLPYFPFQPRYPNGLPEKGRKSGVCKRHTPRPP